MRRPIAQRPIAPAVEPMTSRERSDLCTMMRRIEKAAKSSADEVAAQHMADFEKQLDARYKYDSDPVWKELYETAEANFAKVPAAIAARCKELGIPERFRPAPYLGWRSGGEQLLKERRIELRRFAAKVIEANKKAAYSKISQQSTMYQNEIMSRGITTVEARAMLDRLPTPATLMAPIEVGKIEHLMDQDNEEHRVARYRGY